MIQTFLKIAIGLNCIAFGAGKINLVVWFILWVLLWVIYDYQD